MTNLPASAFGNDAAQNLDTCAKFYYAGAVKSLAIVAKLANVPPIPAQPANPGVAAPLLPHFSYETAPTSGGQSRSQFSLLLDYNERLEAELNDTLVSLGQIPNIVSVPNLKPTGTNLNIPGVTNLEQGIYALATGNSGCTISKIKIGSDTFMKIVGDYTFTANSTLIEST